MRWRFMTVCLRYMGRPPGLRDDGLLKSALARPQQHYAYGESPNIVDLAAVYTSGIVRNHPFVDGNKRTGFVVGILFLATEWLSLCRQRRGRGAGRPGARGGQSRRDWLQRVSPRQCEAAEDIVVYSGQAVHRFFRTRSAMLFCPHAGHPQPPRRRTPEGPARP